MSRSGLVLLALLLASCADGGQPATTIAPTTSSTGATLAIEPESITDDYLPGVEARIFFPDRQGRAPLVVMIPGGAWVTADPAGFEGLARFLAESGIIAAPVEVRAAEDGVVYPRPVEDALCAAGFVADSAMSNGFEAGPIALLGHSSGAHLAALAVLGAVPYPKACPYSEVTPGALIGLAGVYDVSLLADLAEPLFGVSVGEDPALWDSGNPQALAELRPEMPVLLVHGSDDDLVPLSFTSSFAFALEEGDHEVTVDIVAEADHHEIYSAASSGHLIASWVDGLEP